MFIATPQYMSLEDWVQAAMYTMSNYSNLATLIDDDWRQWGEQFLSDPYLSTLNPPDPHFWDEWKPWAEQLVLALNSAPDAPPNSNITPPSPGPGSGRFLIAQNGAFLITQDNRFITTQN
jgi:hypothetical protein